MAMKKVFWRVAISIRQVGDLCRKEGQERQDELLCFFQVFLIDIVECVGESLFEIDELCCAKDADVVGKSFFADGVVFPQFVDGKFSFYL